MKAIIFDFDGTLANTLPICYVAFQRVFKDFDDKELSPAEIRSMFGPSETGIIYENLNHSKKEMAIELFYKEYEEKHQQSVTQNNEMIELITYVKEKGMKIGIVTGKARRSLDISLKQLQMDQLFDVIITGDDVIEPKPHPEGLYKALSALEVERNDSMFIGDSDADIEAGLRAGITTAGVHWLPNYTPNEFLVEPHYMFEHVCDLKKWLEAYIKSNA
ncbi:HAD family hydrolase [Pontibacillus marinus]|uniref:HAD family hydrolase n=1 Tax=Pontibacillus marinus BH030004 = DSM 16465 TaxID=1385511 RepID=A0A0A5GIH9_9BACI|nr:HAD family hydrolase [Pontibacillus marinus]KGX91834.1 HAD family hydrolase [Pontibacillus marinus BH030004 = DSM 16465]